MKTRPIITLLAGMALVAGCAHQVAKAPPPTNVTVNYVDPDKFTDVRENGRTITSTYYLDTLHDFLQVTASPLVGPGQKLVITITDLDLAGENLFNQPNQIRIMKDLYTPKAKLKFQLLDAAGKVVKEGERSLTDVDFLMLAGRPGAGEPLYYDKQMLKKWVQDEFGTKS